MINNGNQRHSIIGGKLFSESEIVSKNLGISGSRKVLAHQITAGSSGYTSSSAYIGKTDKLLLEDFILGNKNKYFEDIYFHDAVCGGAVDMFSMMPFSDFTLMGIKDKKIMDIYMESVENLQPDILLPTTSRDFLVFGRFIGSLTFDAAKRIYTGIMAHNFEHCELIPVGLYGTDPIINLKLPKEVVKVLELQDSRMASILAKLPTNIVSGKSGPIPLQPENTLFVPRMTLSSDQIGTSYYERILPFYIMEKSLFRGAIDLAQRRLKSTLHIQAGDGDSWIPMQDEMEAIKNLFLEAESDPTGAIIVTRNGISTSEIRQGQDFWRVQDDVGFFNDGKYKALGITEQFINGDANYNALDQTMSVMVENMRFHRSNITRQIFTKKIFPHIAITNRFVQRYSVTASQNDTINFGNQKNRFVVIAGETYDLKNYIMPKIHYHKSLRPEGDSQYVDLLQSLNDKGLPIPIAMMAAAGGLNIDDLMQGFEEDIKYRKQIDSYKKKIKPFLQKGEDDGEAEASVIAKTLFPNANKFTAMARDYGDMVLPIATEDGKFKNTSLRDRKRRRDNLIKIGAKVLADLAAKENSND